jgi:hypothetical protein
MIKAELSNTDTATAEGITVHSSSPVLALCRKLIEAGFNPATPMEVYRGKTLCLKARSIGEAAGLQINANGTGFEPFKSRRKDRAAPPTRSLGQEAAE